MNLKPNLKLILKHFVLVLVLFQMSSFAQQLKLSPNTEVSVITVGPGTSLNDAFGHNAFRIKDPALGLNVTYGYGEYDFDAPHFYLKFAQGKLNYLLGKVGFNRFYDFYVYQNRTMEEQVLNLSANEKQNLFEYLENNYKPENRKYLYDFFFDNCATRIRDVLEKTSDTGITFNIPEGFQPKTFRNLIYECVDKNTWGSMGIDLALGAVIDKEATPYEHMFLPKYIFEFFGTATKNGSEKLVKESRTLYNKKEPKASNGFWTSPLALLSLMALILLWFTYKDYKNEQRNRVLDAVIFAFTGFIGIMILLLWFATDHTATANNYNLLWAFPLNLLAGIQLIKKQPKNWIRRYLKFMVIMLALLTLHWLVGIEQFAISLIPLLMALLVRYLYLIHYFKKLNS